MFEGIIIVDENGIPLKRAMDQAVMNCAGCGEEVIRSCGQSRGRVKCYACQLLRRTKAGKKAYKRNH